MEIFLQYFLYVFIVTFCAVRNRFISTLFSIKIYVCFGGPKVSLRSIFYSVSTVCCHHTVFAIVFFLLNIIDASYLVLTADTVVINII